MQSAAWVQLLKLIPPDQQDNVNLVTTVEREISVQQFSQFADSYLVLRGRLGGTTDTDRVYVIPYDQLCYVGFIRPIKDEVLQRIFGEGSNKDVEHQLSLVLFHRRHRQHTRMFGRI